jgi:SAM-dependent methyltransferase
MVKIDLGCGKNKKVGFLGLDVLPFEGVDRVIDLRNPWPFEDGEVEEAHSSHFIEHLTAQERVAFFNELYRVLKPGGQAQIITPHWASTRAFGDPTHCWPPVSEFAYFYLDKQWRAVNAPHVDIEHNPNGFRCDFVTTFHYGLHHELLKRNREYVDFALTFYREAAQDLVACVTKRE